MNEEMKKRILQEAQAINPEVVSSTKGFKPGTILINSAYLGAVGPKTTMGVHGSLTPECNFRTTLGDLHPEQQLTLEQLIAFLAVQVNQDAIIREGFGAGSTYRGYYDQIAFEPKSNVTVREMRGYAEAMVNGTLHGKGDPTPVTLNTLVNIATWESVTDDDEITPRRLKTIFVIEE